MFGQPRTGVAAGRCARHCRTAGVMLYNETWKTSPESSAAKGEAGPENVSCLKTVIKTKAAFGPPFYFETET
jgi:hypothetical protein